MNKSDRKKMTISFIEKLQETTSRTFTTEYTLRYANSTNKFFTQYFCFRKDINSEINKFTLVKLYAKREGDVLL